MWSPVVPHARTHRPPASAAAAAATAQITHVRAERDILKMADLIEMLWFCYEQYMIGNRALTVVYARVLDAIKNRKWVAYDWRGADQMLAEIEQLWLDTASNSEPT